MSAPSVPSVDRLLLKCSTLRSPALHQYKFCQCGTANSLHWHGKSIAAAGWVGCGNPTLRREVPGVSQPHWQRQKIPTLSWGETVTRWKQSKAPVTCSDPTHNRNPGSRDSISAFPQCQSHGMSLWGRGCLQLGNTSRTILSSWPGLTTASESSNEPASPAVSPGISH